MASGAAKAVLDNAMSLIRVPDLADGVVDALKAVQEAGKNDNELVECTSRILDICKLDPKTAGRLEEILNDMSGTNFHSRMRRYVGMPEHVDAVSESRRALRRKEFDALAEAATDASVLEPELGWLVAGEAAEGYRFGHALAGKDEAWSLLPRIMRALEDAGGGGSGHFAGGYLRRVYEKDAGRWLAELDAAYADERTRRLLPALVRLSGITDESVRKIMRGVRDGKLGYDSMNCMLNSKCVSAATFAECVELLSESSDDADASLALSLVYFRLHQNLELPKKAAMRVLFNPGLISLAAESAGAGGDGWEWKEIGSWFVGQHPAEGVRLLEAMVGRVDGNTLLADEIGLGPVMHEIVKAHPEEAWSVLSRHIGPPADGRAYVLQKWLAGQAFNRKGGALSHIPMSEINGWVAADDGVRAAHMASFLPDNFEHIREFLSRYGDRPDVQRALCINFGNEGWSGSGVKHHQEKRKRVQGWMEGADRGTRSWLEFYARHLDEQIRRFSSTEEREF